jgi:Bardet-Biedl syndrome 5 protein
VAEGDLRLLPNEQAFSKVRPVVGTSATAALRNPEEIVMGHCTALATLASVDRFPHLPPNFPKVSGVWNLSSDQQGNLGALFITNVRVVWCSTASDGFNISLPFMQVRPPHAGTAPSSPVWAGNSPGCVPSPSTPHPHPKRRAEQIKTVRLADSKFGPCLVLETTPRAGSYVLGFRCARIRADTAAFPQLRTRAARPAAAVPAVAGRPGRFVPAARMRDAVN